ncbi:hypothetical protein Tcan_03865 [Toxocara canis]|uniref:Uncharacterized protein n=1 Tax=Toxocara canis TaxID=6265 RepID=A0A0B2V570_TOXCA|nr:hypothetical protein Tcan_03865 [Toxocara canis]
MRNNGVELHRLSRLCQSKTHSRLVHIGDNSNAQQRAASQPLMKWNGAGIFRGLPLQN